MVRGISKKLISNRLCKSEANKVRAVFLHQILDSQVELAGQEKSLVISKSATGLIFLATLLKVWR